MRDWESDLVGDSEYEPFRPNRTGLLDIDRYDPPLFAAQKLDNGVEVPGVSGWLLALDLEAEDEGTACLAA